MKCLAMLLATLALTAYDTVPVQCLNVQNAPQGVLAADRPNMWGFIAGADFLYWRAYENGLAYAYSQDSTADTPLALAGNLNALASPRNGRFNEPEVTWEPGFRIYAGANLPFDEWDCLARWTHLNTTAHGSRSISSLVGQNIGAIWLPGDYNAAGTLDVLHASGSWKLHYNVMDALLRRVFFSGKKLQLSPGIGLRGAWIEQSYHADYAGGNLTAPGFFKAKNHFHGVGLATDLDMRWMFHRNWSFLARGLGAVHFGTFKVSQSAAAPLAAGTTLSPTTPYFSISDEYNRIRYAFETGLGFEWRMKYGCRDGQIALSALYELTLWPSQNELKMWIFGNTSTSYYTRDRGDLGLHGISVSAMIDF